MQLVSSRIWTRVAVFISYDDNHYTTGTSAQLYVRLRIILLSQQTNHVISGIIRHYVAAFIFYIFALPDTRVLNSFEELCIMGVASVNSFARVLNPRGGAYLYVYIYIYIYIIIKSRWLTLSLAIRPYHPSLLSGLLDYSLCQYRAVVGKF